MVAATYWTTEAATAKEISIPPDIRTTRSPTAKITFTELVFSRLKKLATDKNCGATADKPTDINIRMTTSQVSVGWARPSLGSKRSLRIDRPFEFVQADATRIELTDDPALLHVQDAIGIEIDFRHFV